MIADIIQTEKGLYTASFVVKQGTEQIGSFFLQGKLGSMEAEVQGKIFDTNIQMRFGKIESYKLTRAQAFRPYLIFMDDNPMPQGNIYQTTFNGGFWNKFSFHQLILNEKIFDLYPIAMGEKGGKSPLFFENKQIAQIDKECVVHNDLHNYKIFAEDASAVQKAVIFAIYMYINAGFKPGKKAISGEAKTISTITNKFLKGKYDPFFVEKIKSLEQ